MSCYDGMDRGELRRNGFRNDRCANAREQINRECYGGGDPNHQGMAASYRRAAEICRELYRQADRC